MEYYNNDRTQTGRYCYGKTRMQTFMGSRELVCEKLLEAFAEYYFVLSPSPTREESWHKIVLSNTKQKEHIWRSSLTVLYNHLISDQVMAIRPYNCMNSIKTKSGLTC
jgi:hypothetical protein